MRRPLLTRALGALVTAAAVLPVVLLSGSSAAVTGGLAGGPTSARAELDRDAAYSCQYTGVESVIFPALTDLPLVGSLPLPVLPSLGGSESVQVSMQVDAPATVAPGTALELKGTATFTFGAVATATNASTAFTLLSDNFGVDVAVGDYERFLRIDELTSTRSTPGSPVVEAEWRLPDFLVPSTASGELRLSMPHEPVVTNPVSTSPESVAFTGLLRTDSTLQPDRVAACAVAAGEDTELGAVTIAATDAGDPDPTDPAAPTDPADPAAPDAAAPPPGSGLPAPPAEAPGGPAPSAPPAPGTAPATPSAVEAPTLLAAEPIPPATVPEGLRLPAWATLFVGGFVAWGLFLALSSARRLRQATTVAVVLALLLVVPTPLNPQAPAEAATGQAQVTLLCVYESQNSTSNDVPKSQPTGVSITLDVPDSVAPGDVVTLTGSASVQAPEDIRSQGAALGFNQLDAISDAFSVGLTIGSAKREVLLADRWQTGKTAFSNPLVVRAPLYFPAFQVPEDASGAVVLELPRNEVADRRPAPFRNGDTPPRVAMEFLASASGNGTSITYVVSCWRSDSGAGRIAAIPVVAAGTPTTPSTGAPADPAAPAAPAAPGDPGDPGDPAAPGAAPGQTIAPPAASPSIDPATGEVVPGAVVPGATGAVPGAPALQGAAAAPTSASAPATSQDIIVPTWVALLAVLLAVGGYGFAGWNHLRTRSARDQPGR